ncbi:hypothetical protein HYALB_00004794 [Hymenoscyphus albidus]|uniref:Uncharacterized protein n=1 Tax=Hymenoscyphus albidus TaxID=595503 RepID=A0A9N9PUF1_9HELO|nr:hypothetical protein HYALB_00004794 [Hymenoscyphus albidus]
MADPVVPPLAVDFGKDCNEKCQAKCPSGQEVASSQCNNGKLEACSCRGEIEVRSVVSPLVNRAFGEDPGVACDSKCAPKCPSGQIPSRTTCEGDKPTLCECQPKGGVRRSAPVSPLVTRALSVKECEKKCDNKCAADGEGKGSNASCTAGQLVTCGCVS